MKAKSLLWSMAMLAVMLFATLPAQSQDRFSEDVPVTEKDGSFNSIVGNGGIFLTDYDDDYERVYLPFEFYYDGELVDYASACTNGYVTFNWSTTRYWGTPGRYNGLYRGVAWAFEDLHAGAGGV